MRSYEELNRAFFRLWGRVSFQFSVVSRDIREEEITYHFVTGTEQFGYMGSITFYGSPIRYLISGPSTSQC